MGNSMSDMLACTDRGKRPIVPPSPRLNDPPEPMILGVVPYPTMPEVQLPKMPEPCVRAVDKLPKLPAVSISNVPGLSAITGSGGKGDDDVLNIFLGGQSEQNSDEIRNLSRAIDLDKLRVAFLQYAGPDKRMDRNEYNTFMRRLGLSQNIADRLWVLLDIDKNGIVDADEFTKTMSALTNARAWLRFCPTCDFNNECDFCQSITNCEDCTRETFCPLHWASHPGNEQSTDELVEKLNAVQ